MKNRIIQWSLGLVLGALPFAAGCAASSGSAADPTNTLVAAATNNPTSSATNAAVSDMPDLPEGVDPATAEVTPVSAETPLPADLNLSAPASELVKLTQSGVDEGVMLAYVTNSTSIFNLTADQIVYLKDIGLPGTVVTAMIQRDQSVKASGNVVAQAAPPEPQPAPEQSTTNELVPAPGSPSPYAAPAAAPTQPSAEEVAPQPDGTAPNTVVTAPPQSTVTYLNFYDSLSPYGSWVDVAGYGRCWQPTVVVVDRGWQPYYQGGRWIYTDAGWYWYSDYSWGWAPFHYGRWFRHNRIGWCWSPGYTWGPSWVSWRYSDSYCGWAPLPPAAHYRPGFGFSYYGRSVAVNFDFGLHSDYYAFVPARHFRAHRLDHYGVPRHEVNRFYNQTIINNTIVNNNNIIVNKGVPPSRIAAATGTRVPTVAIRPTRTPPSTRPERLANNGRSLVVYRPELSKSATTANRLNQRPGSFITQAPTRAAAVSQPKPGVIAPRSSTTTPIMTAPAQTRVGNTTKSAFAPQPNTGAGKLSTTVPNANSAGGTVNRLNSRPQQPGNTSGNNPVARQNTTTPLIMRGSSGSTSATQPKATPTVPKNNNALSGMVIGQNQPAQRPPVQVQAPQTTTQRAPMTTAPSSSGSRLNQRPQSFSSGALENRYSAPVAAPKYTPSAPSYQAPARTYQAPAPAYQAPARTYQAPAPAYQAPVRTAPSAAAPRSYSAPAMQSAPRYSAPAVSAPSPRMSAPSYSAPSPQRSTMSAPSSSGSRLSDRSNLRNGR